MKSITVTRKLDDDFIQNEIGIKDYDKYLLPSEIKFNHKARAVSSFDIASICRPFASCKYEQALIVGIDDKYRVVCEVNVSTDNCSPIQCSIDYQKAINSLKDIAHWAFLVHNHILQEGEQIKPSKEDYDVAYNLLQELKKVDVMLVDSIIVGKDKFYSLGSTSKQNPSGEFTYR